MIVDHIQVRGRAGQPASLLDGEPFLDEADAKLYFAFVAGVKAMRLDVQPAPALSGAPGDVCQLAAGGPAFAPLVEGGGGAPLDGLPWRVPGLMPIRVVLQFWEPGLHWRTIEITQPSRVTGLCCDCDASPDATISLRTEGGEVLAQFNKAGGREEFACDITLAPGRYATAFGLTTTELATTVEGVLSHLSEPEDHAIFLRIA